MLLSNGIRNSGLPFVSIYVIREIVQCLQGWAWILKASIGSKERKRGSYEWSNKVYQTHINHLFSSSILSMLFIECLSLVSLYSLSSWSEWWYGWKLLTERKLNWYRKRNAHSKIWWWERGIGNLFLFDDLSSNVAYITTSFSSFIDRCDLLLNKKADQHLRGSPQFCSSMKLKMNLIFTNWKFSSS